MLKHKFICTDKENIKYKIEQMKINDIPCGKSIFGGNLYKSGIHFQECGENIKGFYLADSENESHKGSPIRVCFLGKFVEEAETLYFDVNMYPNMFQLLFLIFVFLFLSIIGKIMGTVVAIVVLSFFTKEYYDMMKSTYYCLEKIFN